MSPEARERSFDELAIGLSSGSLSRGKALKGVHPKFVQHLAGHASIQLTLDRYSHWMPTMGKHTASAMDEALDEADRKDAPSDEKGALER